MMTLHLDPVDYSNPLVNTYRANVTEALRTMNCGLSMHDFRAVIGPTHTNLVFDILMPFSCSLKEDEIRSEIEKNGYQIDGQIRESYIDGVWNQEDENSWLTEIQIPVRKG